MSNRKTFSHKGFPDARSGVGRGFSTAKQLTRTRPLSSVPDSTRAINWFLPSFARCPLAKSQPCPAMHPLLARLISFLGHPLLVLTYALLLFIAVNPYAFGARSLSDTRAVLLLASVFSTTFLIPGFGVALMKPLGLIRSLEMRDKQERIGPYIITGVFYLWLFKNLVSGGQAPMLYTECVLGAAIGLFFAFFINIFTKISAHATGMGGLVAMTWLAARAWTGAPLSLGTLDLSLNAALALVAAAAGLVGTARLALGAHTPADLWRGYAAGALAVLLASVLV